MFRVAAGVCLCLVPLFLVGIPVQWPALGAAVVLVVVYAVRKRSVLRWRLVPWRLVLLVEGLFLVVTAAGRGRFGLDVFLAHATGQSGSALGVLRTAAVGAMASNGVNNLPSYLALERVADHSPNQLLGLLLGSNLGRLILIWGSLATLLWRERCLARGIVISAREFATVGLIGVPILLVTSWAALVFG